MIGGDAVFVLGGSGHNAGVVNPPSKKKYGYRTNDAQPASAEAWLAGAKQHEGSWWPHWQAWLKKHSGRKSAAPRVPGASQAYPVVEPAPGRYVLVR